MFNPVLHDSSARSPRLRAVNIKIFFPWYLHFHLLGFIPFLLLTTLQTTQKTIFLFLVFTALKHWQLITISPLMIVWPGYAYLISSHNSCSTPANSESYCITALLREKQGPFLYPCNMQSTQSWAPSPHYSQEGQIHGQGKSSLFAVNSHSVPDMGERSDTSLQPHCWGPETCTRLLQHLCRAEYFILPTESLLNASVIAVKIAWANSSGPRPLLNDRSQCYSLPTLLHQNEFAHHGTQRIAVQRAIASRCLYCNMPHIK